MAFFILPLLSARDLDIDPEDFSPRDDISRGLMTRAIWKRQCINLFITYFTRADNILLPFTIGQITCHCHHKMLLPRRQITRRKLCFYYTCKFGVISIKYVIKTNTDDRPLLDGHLDIQFWPSRLGPLLLFLPRNFLAFQSFVFELNGWWLF